MGVYRTTFSPQYVKLVEKRVNKGTKFLDSKIGLDWFRRIKTGVLALDDPYMCVLGQMFKAEAEASGNGPEDGFNFAMQKFSRELDADGLYGENYGFNVPSDEEFEGSGMPNALSPWTLLGETWLAKIRQLKRERPAPRRRSIKE